ncbi:MAG: phenylalanine--tRNA ligase subunit beta [Chitinispirillaceae bacterium]|nr:phenylalanine--tRNA ligase subunit beta [Chitinispirillaceae bacterium]
MKIVYSWLKDIVDTNAPVPEIADILNGAGLEVVSVRRIRVPAKVKIARVLEVSKHPNADKLTVCNVDIGESQPLAVVCGAPNTRAGMLSPLAVAGAVLEDMTVKKTKLRGIESHGMLCSERELGISSDHSGIMSLPVHYKIGAELSSYYPEDAVIEIEITPSRGDCLSILGVAREIAAKFGLPLKETAVRPEEQGNEPVGRAITVAVEDPKACPRYAGRLIRGVTIGPSPEWMQRRLTLAGLRPISNVVDITNYLMLHYGQPMHAFDYRLIEGKKIVVRKAGKPLSFTTLDNTPRSLAPDDLLICDGVRPVALAGVMGGAGSEISEKTTDVFLESAFFDPATIRSTSKRLGLSSDASYRFERGVDPESGLIDALDSAAGLIVQCGGGSVAAGRIDVYPEAIGHRMVSVRPGRVAGVLGHPVPVEKITGFLSSIGLTCVTKGPDAVQCTIPPFRHDLAIEEDLIEEIGRFVGYDAIPASKYTRVSMEVKIPETEHAADTARYAMAYAGFNEIITNSMTSEKRRALLTPLKKPFTILNPLSPDMAQMRTTLAGSMLEVLAYNLNRRNCDNKLFEIGKTYEMLPSGERLESDVLGMLIEGNWTPAAWNTAGGVPCDFFTVKGVLESLAARLGFGEPVLSPFENEGMPHLFGDEAAAVSIGTSVHGTAGRVAKNALAVFDIKATVYYVELDITAFLAAPRACPQYRPLPRFPALERDFCFIMPEHLSAGVIAGEIRRLSPLVEEVRPFDIYRGEKVGSGLKSAAFGVSLRAGDKTLTDKDVEGLCAAVIRTVQEKFGAKLRT